MTSLDDIDINPFDDGPYDEELPISLIPHSFNDNNPPICLSSPLTGTISEEDISSIAHTLAVDDSLPIISDTSSNNIPVVAKNLQCFGHHTASTVDLHADLAGNNTSVQNTSPDKESTKVKATLKKKKSDPKKAPLALMMCLVTASGKQTSGWQ
ncbi:hypothetical protein F5146DRAFT_1142504 [Armillaria mellea]|nr:hypothetical protein F5146DRAFT_1142504 [Armillaria mellea]